MIIRSATLPRTCQALLSFSAAPHLPWACQQTTMGLYLCISATRRRLPNLAVAAEPLDGVAQGRGHIATIIAAGFSCRAGCMGVPEG